MILKTATSDSSDQSHANKFRIELRWEAEYVPFVQKALKCFDVKTKRKKMNASVSVR